MEHLTREQATRLANQCFHGSAILDATLEPNEYNLYTGTWFLDGSKFAEFSEKIKINAIVSEAGMITLRIKL